MINAHGTPKISYDHGVSDKKLIGETIGAFFDRQVETFREREALVVRHQKVRWSWGELAQRVDDLAAGLMALGLERGDRVGIWAPNTSEWTLAQFATAWVLGNGAISSVIAGPRTLAQWKDYFPAVDKPTTAEDEALVDSLVRTGHPSTPGYSDPSYPIKGRHPLAVG